MWTLNDGEPWFADSLDVGHVVQGDVYADLPFQVAGYPSETFKSSGEGKKPALIGESGLGMVVDYTCRVVSQPPGKVGYAHPFRRVAPVRPLRGMISKKRGITVNYARKIVELNEVAGLCYIPLRPEWGLTTSGEFGSHGIVLLYATTTVHQDVLDVSVRVARVSEPAQRIIASKAMAGFGPIPLDPWQAEMAVDRSDSWAVRSDSA